MVTGTNEPIIVSMGLKAALLSTLPWKMAGCFENLFLNTPPSKVLALHTLQLLALDLALPVVCMSAVMAMSVSARQVLLEALETAPVSNNSVCEEITH